MTAIGSSLVVTYTSEWVLKMSCIVCSNRERGRGKQEGERLSRPPVAEETHCGSLTSPPHLSARNGDRNAMLDALRTSDGGRGCLRIDVYGFRLACVNS